MGVQELWSGRNETQLTALLRAVEHDDLASALLAIDGSEASDVQWCLEMLSTWGETLASRIRPYDEPDYQVSVMTDLLVDELDFRGIPDNYYSPTNSFLFNAVRRRRGLPILLSAIWILVGERSGIKVDGVGLPCHFIARVGGAQGLFVDPFGSGRVLETSDCRRLVEELSQGQIPWKETYLEPLSVETIVERVLHNLINSYNMSGQHLKLYRTVRMLAMLCRDSAQFQYMHARIAEEVGAFQLARVIYEELLVQFAESEEAERACTRLSMLTNRSRWVN